MDKHTADSFTEIENALELLSARLEALEKGVLALIQRNIDDDAMN